MARLKDSSIKSRRKSPSMCCIFAKASFRAANTEFIKSRHAIISAKTRFTFPGFCSLPHPNTGRHTGLQRPYKRPQIPPGVSVKIQVCFPLWFVLIDSITEQAFIRCTTKPAGLGFAQFAGFFILAACKPAGPAPISFGRFRLHPCIRLRSFHPGPLQCA